MKFSTVLVSATVLSASVSCAKDDSGDSAAPSLTGGEYAVTLTALQDECFPTSTLEESMALPFLLEPEPEGALWVRPGPLVTDLIPDLVGGIVDGDILASGFRVAALTTSCWMSFDAAVAGRVTRPTRIEGTLSVRYASRGLQNAFGEPSDCSALASGAFYDVLPFPAFDDPAHGECLSVYDLRASMGE